MFKYYIFVHMRHSDEGTKLDTFTHLQRKSIHFFCWKWWHILYDIIILKSYVIGVFQQTIYERNNMCIYIYILIHIFIVCMLAPSLHEGKQTAEWLIFHFVTDKINFIKISAMVSN